MNENVKLELGLKLNTLADLWQQFCEKHTELYEATCEEYIHLMSSDMDKLEEIVAQKANIIAKIDEYDRSRLDLIEEISKLLEIPMPEKMSELLANENINKEFSERIEKLNLILLDIIENIMEQNRKNQFFLNKAIHSLNELKESFSGQGNYSTYSAKGTKKSTNVSD